MNSSTDEQLDSWPVQEVNMTMLWYECGTRIPTPHICYTDLFTCKAEYNIQHSPLIFSSSCPILPSQSQFWQKCVILCHKTSIIIIIFFNAICEVHIPHFLYKHLNVRHFCLFVRHMQCLRDFHVQCLCDFHMQCLCDFHMQCLCDFHVQCLSDLLSDFFLPMHAY